jgi:hypothetical protein
MNAPLRKPWTQDHFFSWAERQDTRYEFDGIQPVAMTGGSLNHDRITVSSIRRYTIVESSGVGLMVLDRQSPDEVWKTTILTADDILRLPEIGIEFPVAEIYAGINVSDQQGISE